MSKQNKEESVDDVIYNDIMDDIDSELLSDQSFRGEMDILLNIDETSISEEA